MIKNALNHAFFQWLLATLIVAYLKFCFATMRITHCGREHAEKIWKKGGPVVYVFWHERLHLGHKAWPRGMAQDLCVMASGSKAGNVSVLINKAFGHVSARGSTAKSSDPQKSKGGTKAFREALKWLQSGKGVAMTPDGPRGPRRSLSPGTVKLSLLTKAPIVVVGASCRPHLRLNSWDRMMIPLPFAKVHFAYDVIDNDFENEEKINIILKHKLDTLVLKADQALFGEEPLP
jgi:lysophospholipid acyltransferase (LPLAT)-like uncharacterized protein